MSITRTAAYAKIRLRLGDRTTRRDGTTITTPRYGNTDIATAIDDAIRDRQPLIEALDKTWYLSVFDFVGQTDAIAASSSTTLPVVANQQYAAPSNLKEFVRLARRDLTNFPTVRFVPYETHDQYYASNIGLFAGFGDDATTQETCSLVTYNSGGTLSNRIRILPAPAATTYTYRLWFVRTPTEPTADGQTLDIPPGFQEIVCLDAAIELASSTNAGILPTLHDLRDRALQARMDDPGGRFAGKRVMRDARM